MLRRHVKGARNRLDLNDRVQVRIVRKRLKVSDQQLSNLVQTVGNSIAAVTKEANSRKSPAPANNLPSAAIIVSVQKAEGPVEETTPSAAPQPA
jgi:hypothetical protein